MLEPVPAAAAAILPPHGPAVRNWYVRHDAPPAIRAESPPGAAIPPSNQFIRPKRVAGHCGPCRLLASAAKEGRAAGLAGAWSSVVSP